MGSAMANSAVMRASNRVPSSYVVSTEHKVHPNQISRWKKELCTHAPDIFSGKKSATFKTEEELTAPPYEEIGRLKMEVKWLEKKL